MSQRAGVATEPRRPGRTRRRLARRTRTMTGSGWFSAVVVGAIALNAALLGVETYEGFARRWESELGLLETLLLTVFALEVLVRALAHADDPAGFFRSPWNLFDLIVVAGALLPFVTENATILRLLRLARVVRTARLLPQLRIIITAIGKSIPGAVSFLLVGTLLLYLYAMLGWTCFAEADPDHYGTLGRAALTLFVLMTLDGLGDAVEAGLRISPWSVVYYASYVVLTSFLLVNMLIGVVINSLDQARAIDEERKVREEPPARPAAHRPAPAPGRVVLERKTLARPDPAGELLERIAAARGELDDLERLLVLAPPQREHSHEAVAGGGPGPR
jgi:voltage-gated sodium channel